MNQAASASVVGCIVNRPAAASPARRVASATMYAACRAMTSNKYVMLADEPVIIGPVKNSYMYGLGKDGALDVELILLAVNHQPLAGCLLHPVVLGLHERDVVPVEDVQVLVVERRPLAPDGIPRLERLGRLLVLGHDLVDPLPRPLRHRHVAQHHALDVLGDLLQRQRVLGMRAAGRHPIRVQFGPAVVDQVFCHVGFAGHDAREIGIACRPPPRPRGDLFLPLLGVDLLLAPFVNGRRGTLKDKELPGALGQRRRALHTGGPRADEPHPLALQLVAERIPRLTARDVVLPPGRVHRLALKVLQPLELGHLGVAQDAVGQHDELGRHGEVDGVCCRPTVGRQAHHPPPPAVVPGKARSGRSEKRPVPQPPLLSDAHGVQPDLLAARVAVRRDVSRLLQQRQVDAGFGIALQAGVPVPVPGAADVAGRVDQANVVGREPGLDQTHGVYEAAEARTHDEELDVVAILERRGRRVERLVVDPRVVNQVREVARRLACRFVLLEVHVLLAAVLAPPFLRLLLVSLVDGGDVGLCNVAVGGGGDWVAVQAIFCDCCVARISYRSGVLCYSVPSPQMCKEPINRSGSW
ncbi:uncharacterized protein PpBr36_10219 [Pyricularia pennisetigena]|uniref:uncharacterized protein n=1 Tax=Pyricularia pennisetigena TaxID=1578925 RepID=UPI001150EBB8|nr:uncharacterized protein PpBr36_10219 [Pyricularia pennisetigena]TLS21416.1 hypothetical protein PpBr36_10219 [Pyricularia pennisetigena]